MPAGALGPSAIASATGLSQEKCQVANTYLTDHGDECVFATAAEQKQKGTDRLVIISRYRLLLVRWKYRRPAFKELRLLDLRGITCEGDRGAWGFADGETAQIKSPRLQEAVKMTLKSHALITLCLDVPPLALSLPKHWGALGSDFEGKEIDMGFSRVFLAISSYSETHTGGETSGKSAVVVTKEQRSRRNRLASFMAQLISRPAKHDRVLDLTYCAELTATDFAAAAVALRHTSMFSGLRLYDITLGDAIISLCECCKTSKTLETLILSGVLPDPGKRNSARALCEALASGAASKTLPLTALDLSDNEIRDNGVIAIGGLISHLKHGLKLLDLTACHASARNHRARV